MAFLIIMLAGLIGLLMMALPGMHQHGHVGGTTNIAPPVHGGLQLGHAPGAHASGHALPGAHAGHAVPHAGAAGAPHAAPGAVARAAGGAQNAEAPAGFE